MRPPRSSETRMLPSFIASDMDLAELEKHLTALGCPREKSAEMAAQLDRRARQLAGRKDRSYEDALGHLLNLMRQGWAAQKGNP